jgi:hypothetical protein
MRAGVAIHTLPGREIMLSLVEFEPGSVVEWPSHPHEQMSLLLEGAWSASAHAQIAFDFAGPVVDAEHLAGWPRFAEFGPK